MYEDINQPAGDIRILRSSDGINWSILSDTAPIPNTGYGASVWRDRIWVLGGPINFPQPPQFLWYTEDTPEEIHRADYDADGKVSLSELLRVIQFFQAGRYQCDGTTEDSYAPGPGWETCYPHSSDYLPQDWRIGLSELLRAVQFYNVGSYHACPDAATEDGYCPGAG